MTLNASSGLPAVFVPLRPSADNTRDRNPFTGAGTGAGSFRIGAVNAGLPSDGSHPDVTDAASPSVAPRLGRRSAQRGTAVAAVPKSSQPGRPPRPTRVSTLTPAAAPGTTGDAGIGEELDGTDVAGPGLTAEEPPTPEVLARSETPPATTGPRGVTAESPPEEPPPSTGTAPRPPRRTGADGRDTEPAAEPDPEPPAETVVSEPAPPTGPAGSANPTAGAKPMPTPTPNATASAPTRPTNWAALREPEPASTV